MREVRPQGDGPEGLPWPGKLAVSPPKVVVSYLSQGLGNSDPKQVDLRLSHVNRVSGR